eukprot:2846439-Alexandrium_andersonii.AAC.1
MQKPVYDVVGSPVANGPSEVAKPEVGTTFATLLCSNVPRTSRLQEVAASDSYAAMRQACARAPHQ